MCLAVPGKVVEKFETNGIQMGKMDFDGITKNICLAYVPDIQIGEYALVHVGFAIEKLDEKSALERHNANNVGGNISGGSTDLRQLFLRPTRRTYSTPVEGLYICSSSTPPGGGVHGMCGYYAARKALRNG